MNDIGTGTDFASLSIATVFSGRAQDHPDKVAVVCDDSHLTYGALDSLSDEYSKAVISEGLFPGQRVAIDLERSIDYVVAIFAIFKSGCSYVPLEPMLPRERVKFIVEESNAALVISENIEGSGDVPICRPPSCLARQAARRKMRAAPIERAVAGEAYVIFTSGSTGYPKGVSVSHDNVLRLVHSASRIIKAGPADVWTLFHSLCFDFSVWELFGSLLSGAKIVIVPYWVVRDPGRFIEVLAGEWVTILNQTPTAFQLLTAAKDKQGDPGSRDLNVRCVIFGGEALNTSILLPWFRNSRTSSVQFVNMYGITETTVHVTHRVITAEDVGPESVIGEPLPGWQLHVLGPDMELLPAGVTGELYVGGDGVARGYVGRPALTAERFVPDPFGPEPGARLYRSGDYGYARPNGELVYVGRQDSQVKVRGFRVELGEVERALLDCASVSAAAVVATGERQASRIVAFVVPSRAEVSEKGVIDELGTRLPAYMWPSAIFVKDQLPMTFNGKIDTSAIELDAMGRSASERASDDRAGVPAILQEIFRSVLDLQSVELDDNFFLLGGDSLVGIGIVAEGRARGLDFELQDLFELPTISALAAEIARRREAFDGSQRENSIEEILIEVMEGALGIGEVGRDSNFFLLGGDSLVGVGVVAECRSRGLELELRDLFTYPTISELAAQLALRGGAVVLEPAPVGREVFSLVPPEARAFFAAAEGVDDAYPLSALQAGMLYHSEREPQSAIYHELFGLRLEGRFDREAFEAALARMVARHAILRTGFASGEDGQWYQVVHGRADIPLEVTDLRSLDRPGRSAMQQGFYEAEKGCAFAWSQAPLLRIHVHLHAESEFNVTFSCHHIILDGWSMASLVTELLELYAAQGEGRSAEALPLRSEYRDFIVAEAAAAADAASEAFWREQLEGHERLALPGARRSEDPKRIAHHHRSLEPLRADLQRVAATLGVPLKSVLLTAFVKCLSVVSGQRDVITGLVSNGRLEVPDGERVLGLFLNSLPFRVALTTESWAGLVRRVFALEQAAIPHRRFPLPAIQRLANNEQLFDTLFNYVHYHVARDVDSLPGLRLIDTFVDGSTNFSLVGSFALEEADLRLELAYDAGLFDPAWIEAFAGYLERALAAIASDPEASQHYATVLSQEQLSTVLHEWNNTATDYPQDDTLLTLFSHQVAQQPDAVAVIFDDASLTYAELDRRADQLAARLAAANIAPEERIGLCVERSLEMIVGILGILKAGAAYLPLDPQYPDNHLQLIIEDAWQTQPRWICLGSQSLASRISHLSPNAHLLSILGPAMDQVPPSDRSIHPEQLAYVIYTSGSTGRAKGVMVPHRGIANLARAQNETFRLDRNARVLQFASLSFDASVSEIATTLAAGASLVVAKRAAQELVEEVSLLIQSQRVTHWTAPPSLLEVLDRHRFPSLDCVISAGESCSPTVAERWSEGLRFINAYGPTEVTVCASMGDEPVRCGEVNMGRAIAGSSIYLLDDVGLPCVPNAEAGEICVSGVGIARGYFRNPRLTAERFTPDPFGAGGGTLYRTGDLARRNASGELVFRGRTDSQLKVRGHRVEPGEIESALTAHPQITSAAVALVADKLTAAVVEVENAELTFEQLTSWISLRLPRFMHPSRILFVPALPLNNSGKIDYRRLAELDGERDLPAENPASLSMEHRMLAEIWCDVLGLERVDTRTSFFSLGGDSLLAVKLSGRIKTIWPEFRLKELFEFPTIAQIAERLSPLGSDVPQRHQPEPNERPSAEDSGPFPLTEVQRAYLLGRSDAFELGGLGTHGYSEYRGRRIDPARASSAWNKLIVRHAMLRSVFDVDQGLQEPLEAIPAYDVAFEDLSSLDPAVARRRIDEIRAEMSGHMFDPARWPLFDVRVSKLADDDWRLHVSIDGLIVDAHSYMLILEEWGEFYRDPAAVLPEPRIGFREYVHHLVEQKHTAAYHEARTYWAARAPGFPDAPQLPLSGGNGQGGRSFTRRSGKIDRHKWSNAKNILRESNITPTVLLLTCYSYVLYRWSRQERFSLNLTLFDRPPLHPDIFGVVGDFTSLLLLEVRLDPAQPLQDNAQGLQQRLWTDIEHKSFGGLEFMRKLREARGNRAVSMPFVFSSALSPHYGASDRATILDVVQAEREYEQTQTSQVLLDHMVAEEHGALIFNWDAVESAFLEGVLDSMFAAYVQMLEAVCSGEIPLHAPYQFPSTRRGHRQLATADKGQEPC